jgi:hypothetical protein
MTDAKYADAERHFATMLARFPDDPQTKHDLRLARKALGGSGFAPKSWMVAAVAVPVFAAIAYFLWPRPQPVPQPRREERVERSGPSGPQAVPLTASVQSLTFPYSPGPIPAQKFEVLGSGDIPQPVLSDKWVTVDRGASSPGKTEFEVRVSPVGLSPGVQTAHIDFSPQTRVLVEITIPGQVKEGPLEVQQTMLTFPAGGDQQHVIATGPSVIRDPVASPNWLRFQRSHSQPGRAEFIVSIKPADLAPGTYKGQLAFSPRKIVAVELTVPPRSGDTKVVETPLEVSPAQMSFTYVVGDPAPAPQSISASGPSNVPTPIAGDTWIRVSPGPSTPGKTQYGVQILPDKLDNRAHFRGEIVFTPAKKVIVDLRVSERPTGIGLSYRDLTWSGMGAVLAPNETLTFKGKTVNKGTVNISIPSYPGTVTVRTDGITVVEQPSGELNRFTVTLKNTGSAAVSTINFRWDKQK